MSKAIEDTANSVMEALGAQKEWATCIKILREQGFTVELASTMERITLEAHHERGKTSFESLMNIRMILSEPLQAQSTFKYELARLLERHGYKNPNTLAVITMEVCDYLKEQAE